MRNKWSVLAITFLLAVGLSQAAFVEFISGTVIDTEYNAATGQLTLSDTILVVLQDENGVQSGLFNAAFYFTAFLQQDDSVPGSNAMGIFGNGSFTITDMSGLVLGGNVDRLDLQGTHSGTQLSGNGNLTLDSGWLLADIRPGYNLANLWNLQFRLDQAVLNFSADYTGASDINITPIPEPATLAILGLGGLALLRRKHS